jgi:hypothetical protein
VAIRIEPAIVHFNGGPLDGIGTTDGDDQDLKNATARLVCISTKNGERIPWAVKGLTGTGPRSTRYAESLPPRYRADRSEYIDGRLHIYCSYDESG